MELLWRRNGPAEVMVKIKQVRRRTGVLAVFPSFFFFFLPLDSTPDLAVVYEDFPPSPSISDRV